MPDGERPEQTATEFTADIPVAEATVPPAGDDGPMHPQDRYVDDAENWARMMKGFQTSFWTAMPFIMHAPDDTDLQQNTVKGEPSVKLNRIFPEDKTKTEWVEFPKLADLPVFHFGSGGASITMPVKEGDEGLMVTASRSIDKWWYQGGKQEQMDARMHDISDSFVFPGFRSQPNALPNVSPNTMQIRTKDGTTNIDFNPNVNNDNKGQVTVNAPDNPTSVNGKAFNTNVETSNQKAQQQITLDTPTVNVPNGNVIVKGIVDASQGFFKNGVPIGGGSGGGGGGITSVTLTGDVIGSGTDTVATTVVGLRTVPIAAASPVAGQFLGFNGTDWAPVSGGVNAGVYIASTPPATPFAGELWWNDVTGQLYVWYTDPNSSQWVVANTFPGTAYLPLSGGSMTGNLSISVPGVDAELCLTTYNPSGPQTRTWCLHVINGGTNTYDPYYGFSIRDENAGQDRLFISFNSGAVGIGTVTPSTRLEVAGAIRSSGVNASLWFDQRDGSRQWAWYGASGSGMATLYCGTNGDRLSIDTGGNIYSNGTYLFQAGGGGAVNSNGGPFLYADNNNTRMHLGPNASGNGNQSFYVQNAAGANVGGFIDNGVVAGQNGNYIALNNGSYCVIYDASNRQSIYLGGTADPRIYYRNATHSFQSVAGSSGDWVTINSSGLTITGSLALSVGGNISAGGYVYAANSMFITNNRWLYGTETGGAQIPLIGIGGDNNVYIYSPGHGNVYYRGGSHYIQGTIWCSSNIVIPNGYWYYGTANDGSTNWALLGVGTDNRMKLNISGISYVDCNGQWYFGTQVTASGAFLTQGGNAMFEMQARDGSTYYGIYSAGSDGLRFWNSSAGDIGRIDNNGIFWCRNSVEIASGCSFGSLDSGGAPRSLMTLATSNNHIYIGDNNRNIYCQGHTLPPADNTWECGASGQAWSQVWAYSYPSISDRRLKTDFQDLPNCLDLVSAITPQRFRWRERRDKFHWGFIAQDVASVMNAAGYEFGGHIVGNDAKQTESLDTRELVAVLWKAVQELRAEVRELKHAAA